jgi:predicted ribosomally synthesized peptide with nif11-like leader
MKLTQEIIEKAKAAGSAEELLAIAKENGIDMTADEAATYFSQLNPKYGELDDDDLDNVAGGACGKQGIDGVWGKEIKGSADYFAECWVCGKCGSTTLDTTWQANASMQNIVYTKRYCGACGERAWCQGCKYFETIDGKNWCTKS